MILLRIVKESFVRKFAPVSDRTSLYIPFGPKQGFTKSRTPLTISMCWVRVSFTSSRFVPSGSTSSGLPER